jgi:hypothetical protein
LKALWRGGRSASLLIGICNMTNNELQEKCAVFAAALHELVKQNGGRLTVKVNFKQNFCLDARLVEGGFIEFIATNPENFMH